MGCEKVFEDIFYCMGRLNLPEIYLLCAFGRIQSAPIVAEDIGYEFS